MLIRHGQVMTWSSTERAFVPSTVENLFFLTQEEWIYALYQGALGRNPTGPELAAAHAGLGAVSNNGVDYLAELQSQTNDIYNTAEYIGFGTTDSEFIEDLYEGTLGRGSDPTGHAFWLSELITQGGTQTRASVTSNFAASKEFRLRAFFVYSWDPSETGDALIDSILTDTITGDILVDTGTGNILRDSG
jgi:hypothetical protein